MSDMIESVRRYLGGMLGDQPQTKEWALASLPLHLRERYRLFRTNLFGREWILALESKGWEAGTPSEYRNQAKQLEQAAGVPVVLVLFSIPAAVRNRMVHMNIPFLFSVASPREVIN